MEIKPKLCRLVDTLALGVIGVNDVCRHPNNGITTIHTPAHAEYANGNDYKRAHLHIISPEPYEDGDYVIEHGEVFGPVEVNDRPTLENPMKIIASTDYELGLPKIPRVFLRKLYSYPKIDRVLIDYVKLYNNGDGWKYALLPSEWNDSVQTKLVPYTDENIVKVNIPDMSFTVEDLYDAYGTFAFCSDSERPYNDKELIEKFDDYLIKRMGYGKE